MKKVYKYGTGQEVPEGAVYLSTQTETITEKTSAGIEFKKNLLVWHYFLVETQD